MGGVQNCGWDAADHKDFLRIKTKHKDKVNTVAFITEMRRAVPSIDEEEIQNHLKVYQNVQGMLSKKKTLMTEYKEEK
jgi:hypothetical protein